MDIKFGWKAGPEQFTPEQRDFIHRCTQDVLPALRQDRTQSAHTAAHQG